MTELTNPQLTLLNIIVNTGERGYVVTRDSGDLSRARALVASKLITAMPFYGDQYCLMCHATFHGAWYLAQEQQAAQERA